MSKVPKAKAKPSYIRWVQVTGRSTNAVSAHSRQIKHNRQNRAKCRLLHAAGVSKDALVREFGGVYSTMVRVIANGYVERDVQEDDLRIALQDASFQARLDHLEAHGFDNPQHGKPTNRQTHQKRVVQPKQEPEAQGEMEDPIVVRSESPPAIIMAPPVGAIGPDPVNNNEPQDFLLEFLTRVGLKNLHGPLKKIGVDKDGLYRISGYEEERLDAFLVKLGKLVPEMTPFMCLTLSEEIRRLAGMPVDVD
ncbi:hypothetical protein C8R47DRAFT_1317716 [Mycena vitilis]|nr:hypothetical protein C8R47DRAFT_1317716 [Mycena vitilis]